MVHLLSNAKPARLHGAFILLLTSVICACSSSNNSDNALLRQSVEAARGGSFTTTDGMLTVSIPAAALSTDTQLVVTKANLMDMPAETMQLMGDAYVIDLGSATLSADMTLAFELSMAPEHPELAETAVYSSGEWSRVSANFYRASDNVVTALVDSAGTYQPMFRTLQKASGDGVIRGEQVFLYETFDNEDFFGGVLGLHTLLSGLTPTQAVGAGVQVDLNRVPQGIVDVMLGSDFESKQAALNNPDITVALLKADAVVGVKAVFESPESNTLVSAGITCALCHVNVAPTEFELSSGVMTALPIGALMLNGVPNTKMDAGLILSLTPFASGAGQATVDFLQSFGPGNFDVRALPDNVLDDGVANPTNTPPLWNFVDLASQNYLYNWDGLFDNGEDPANALASQAEAVYDLVMHANGAFGTASGSIAPELSITPPQSLLDALAAAEDASPGNDIPAQSLLDVQDWQRSIVSPAPAEFDEAMAETGFKLFYGKANCSGCHSSAEFTGPVLSASIVLNAPQGGLAEGIKTPGLRGLAWTAPYFHDGSAATLMDVMDIYAGRITPGLTESEKAAVVEYMLSL